MPRERAEGGECAAGVVWAGRVVRGGVRRKREDRFRVGGSPSENELGTGPGFEGCTGHTVHGTSGAGRLMSLERGGEEVGKRRGGLWEGPGGQRQQCEDVSAVHTFIIYTHRG